MGGNAQRRREERVAPNSDVRQPKPADTKTMQRLRAAAAQITTRQQLEEIIARAHPDHQGQIRKLLTGLVQPGLPCCGPAILAAKVGRDRFTHGRRCPSRNLVVAVQ